MLVRELEGLYQQNFAGDLAQMQIWNQEVGEISGIKLTAAFAQLKNRIGQERAAHAMRYLTHAIRRAVYFGYAEDREVCFEERKPVLSLAKFTCHLEAMSTIEKRMFLFALGSNMSIRDVTGLTWSSALAMQRSRKLNHIANDILNTSVRHMKLNLVFWVTATGGRAIPCYDADNSILDIIDSDWEEYASQFASLPHRPF